MRKEKILKGRVRDVARRSAPLVTSRLSLFVTRSLLLFTASLVLTGFARGQDVKVLALVSQSTIGSEEQVTYTIEIQGTSLPEIKAPEPPETRGLVLSSRFPATSRNISVVNGAMTVSVGFSWTYSPVDEGQAVIEATKVVAGGKTFETEPIRVTVVPQSQRPVRRQPARRPSLFDQFVAPQDPPEPTPVSERDIYIRAAPNKRRVFQNEQLTIEYGLYFRNGIQLRQSRLADSWDAEGFWREELEVETRPVPRTIVENGLRYNMIVLKRVAVFPTRSGDLTVDPLRIESEASIPSGPRDPFFSLRNRYQPVELNSPPVRVTVLPFPENAPATFNGAVGSYRLSSEVDRTELDVGESIELTVTVSGNGNLATLEGPTLSTPGVFEVYDPEVSSRINRAGSTVRGYKTFTYILIPRSNGTFEIPPVTFTYLDPSSRSYKTLTTEPHRITVTGTSAVSTPALATASGLPVDDIPPIVTASGRWRALAQRPVYRSPWIWGGLILPLVLLGALLLYEAASRKLETDVRYARNLRARPIARKHLKHAEELRASGDAKGYYDALEQALRGFCGNRLNIGEWGLTQDELADALAKAGAGPPTTLAIRELLAECDRVRFAPVAPDQQAMDTAHERAATVIETLHEELTRHARARHERESTVAEQ